MLLYAIRCDRSYLCQHVLPGIENAPARPEGRFSVAPNVPSESHTWLEQFVLVWQKTRRWKSRITQVLAIGCLRRCDDGLGKLLRLEPQAVVQSKISSDLPRILKE